MARKNRHYQPQGIYHVMLRGNNKQCIFFNDAQREKFLHYVEEATKKHNCKIHLFCLMSNHVHMVIEIYHIPLSKIMQSITSIYARIVNKMQNTTGHLFEDRFKSIPVQDETYLLELSYYIHYNPVAAYIVKLAGQYPWSSHSSYCGKNTFPWVTTDFIKNLINKYLSEDGGSYETFLKRWKIDFPKPMACQFDENGCLTIKDDIKKKMNEEKPKDFTVLTIPEIIKSISIEFDSTPDEVMSISLKRDICRLRTIIAYYAHHYAKHKLKDIALYFDCNGASISKRMRSHVKLPEFQNYLTRAYLALNRALNEKIWQ